MATATGKRKHGQAKSKSIKAAGRSFDWQPMLGVLLHPVARRVYGGLLVALLFVGLYRVSLASLSRNPRFQLHTEELKILDPPPYIPAGQLERIELPASISEPISIFDPRLVRLLSEAYEKNPWVERVVRVAKVYPNDLRVELRLRKPVAAVWHARQWWYLIDKSGVRLPGRHRERPEVGYRLPFLLGVVAPPPKPGEVWDTPAVLDGAWLAELWQRSGLLETIKVTCIDVSNVGGRVDRAASEVVLRLESIGTRILWGRTARPGQSSLVADDPTKLEILRNALVRDGYLARDPHLQRVRELDIKSGNLVFRWNR